MIVTPRARWIILLSVGTATVGLVQQDALVVRFSTAVLLWLGMEWLLFKLGVEWGLGNCVAHRQLRNHRGTTKVLWEGRPVDVRISINGLPDVAWLSPSYVHVHDLLPTAVEATGANGAVFTLGVDKNVELTYKICAAAPGTVHFTGLRLVANDPHGFFRAERFIGLSEQCRILPIGMHENTIAATRKYQNILPAGGVHSLLKSGAGSELLEIREYQTGDPPRSIAWKASARRDVLMSRQFESEVPVRSHLLVDMSPAVRVGYPGPCTGARFVSLASSIVRALTLNRDPVGLSVFDGKRVHISKPSINRRSVTRMMDELCRQLDRPLEAPITFSRQLIRDCFEVMQIRYPTAVAHSRESLRTILPHQQFWTLRLRVAALLCNHYRLDRLAMGELADNKSIIAQLARRFLVEHGAQDALPFTAREDDKETSRRIDQAARLIRQAVARSKDNELFVLMAELPWDVEALAPLLQSIKLARAKRHRVAIALVEPNEGPIKQKAAWRVVGPSRQDDGESTPRRIRHHETAFEQLRSEFSKLDVPIAIVTDPQLPRLVMSQLEIARSGRATA